MFFFSVISSLSHFCCPSDVPWCAALIQVLVEETGTDQALKEGLMTAVQEDKAALRVGGFKVRMDQGFTLLTFFYCLRNAKYTFLDCCCGTKEGQYL